MPQQEHLISYSPAMVAARRAGRKTQTRRIINPQPANGWAFEAPPALGRITSVHPKQGKFGVFIRRGVETDFPETDLITSPYGQPGDTLLVREAAWMWCRKVPDGKTPTGRDKWRYEPNPNASPRYQIDSPARPALLMKAGDMCWRFKIPRFLPRWACRSRDEVVSIRVERLQDISEADAIAEGCYQEPAFNNMWTPDGNHYTAAADGPVRAYRALWGRINGVGSWDANPWVWVVTFRKVDE